MKKTFELTPYEKEVRMEVIESSKFCDCRLVDSAKFTVAPISGKANTTFRIMKNGVPMVIVQAIYNGVQWRFAVSRQTLTGRETLLDAAFKDGQKLELAIPEDCYIL